MPETVAACLSPPGVGAVATLAVHGPSAWETVRGLFRRAGPGDLPAEPTAGQFWLGWLGDGPADQVVLAVRRGAPDFRLEVHSHGGREVTRLLLEQLEARQVRVCTWQDLERRTSGDHLRSQAVIALTE